MIKIVLGLNALEPATWTTHEVQDTCRFLADTFGTRFPNTCKIFHGQINKLADVTPRDDAGIDRLQSLDGTLYVIVYPAAQAVVLTGFLVASLIVAWILSPDKEPGPPRLRPQTGSPNNKLGERQNSARVLGRIPDIFGLVRAVPDLIQVPYTVYNDHREQETCLMCVGRGTYTITDMREGDMLAGQVEGLSVGVYAPGNIPTGVEGTSTRQDQIGTFIDDPVWVVRKVEAVNGQPLLPENAFTILGDVPLPQDPWTASLGITNTWYKVLFKRTSATTGIIWVGEENTRKVRVGDVLLITSPTTHITTPTGLSQSKRLPLSQAKGWMAWQNGTGSIPTLTADVTVTGLSSAFFGLAVTDTIEVNLSSAASQAGWAMIEPYVAGLGVGTDFEDCVGNGGAIITVPDREWIGPFFVDDELSAPDTRTVICNFVAQQGLYADDGKTTKPFDVEIEVEVTAADGLGSPVGSPATQTVTVLGSIASRNTRAATMKIILPEVQGRFLIRARRLTRTPWKQDAPSQFGGFITTDPARRPNQPDLLGDTLVAAQTLTGSRVANNGGGASLTDPQNSSYVPFHGHSQDEIRWTHCYSMTSVANGSFGDLTLLHTRTLAPEGATTRPERRLSCLAFRNIQTWNGTVFGGALAQNNNAENVLFHILKDFRIGNLPDDQIDFAGIADAFAQVRAAFGGPESDGIGGEVAGQFNYTFDDDQITLEETIGIICRACFCVPYREGDVIKVKPDLASSSASLLINHRNRIPGSEQRTITFGTEGEFDGIRLEYSDVDLNDPNDYAIKTYTIPPENFASRPKVLDIPGIRLKKHAAWHAWRAYNQLLYQNTVVQLEATEEAALLTRDSRILVADGTRAITSTSKLQDGEVVGVSGATITTSQNVVTSGPCTVFLQHTDGTVESIAVASNPDVRHLVLAAAPSIPLVTNDTLGVRTGYILVHNDHNTAMAFKVTDKACTKQGEYEITATNYSHAFHWSDGLYFWVPIITQSGIADIRDWGPYEFSLAVTGGAAFTDATRGRVYRGTANTHHISITSANVFASASYTKSAWIARSAGISAAVLASVETNDEIFGISSVNALLAGHNSIAYCQSPSFPDNVWTMVSVTYDSDSEVMVLFVNGEEVDRAAAVPARPLGNLRLFGQFSGVNGLVGFGDDLRYWARVLSPEEIRELYLKTRL